eukprot:6316092-Prorocentrum_lima.AAC.1
MKQKKKLPVIELPQGRSTPPSTTRKIFETWITEIAVIIGTWCTGAQDQWMNVVRQARKQHDD